MGRPRTKTKRTLTPAARRRKRLQALETKARRAQKTNRVRAKKILTEIRKRLERLQDDFHAIGRLLARLQKPALHGSLGYSSFDKLLAGEKLVARSTAYRMI